MASEKPSSCSYCFETALYRDFLGLSADQKPVSEEMGWGTCSFNHALNEHLLKAHV